MEQITTFAKLTMLEVAVDNSNYTEEEKQALTAFWLILQELWQRGRKNES